MNKKEFHVDKDSMKLNLKPNKHDDGSEHHNH